MLEQCAGALIDDCEFEIIDPSEINNIVEINFDKIETKSLKR